MVKVTPMKRAALARNQRILDRTITKACARPNFATAKTERTAAANIKVIVRVRPPNNREGGDNFKKVIDVIDDGTLVFDPEEAATGFFFHGVQQKGRDLLKKTKKNMKFYFDRVYPECATTDEVFRGTTYSLINSIMDGYNCSVFAYGATGAGKTFTMTGTASNRGITYLTMTELFEKQKELSSERDFEIGITYLEVYNELVKDLLNPGPPLNLREDSNYGVIVAGIKVFQINNSDELFTLLQQGNLNRTQHPTDSNAESSRSHALFQVYLKMTIKKTKEIRTAKLSMIDLAGSERGAATGYVGARFTEGANINKSLLALGNCINSLADGHRHVPYRDSKLTRLLKDSLGGNCRTVMIANISPSSLTYEDTYNTLKYATRASTIKANVHKNVAKTDLNVVQYVKLVEELTKDNEHMKNQLENEKLKNETLEKECLRLRLEKQNSVPLEPIDETLTDEIKSLTLQKHNLLERRFQLERNESCTALRRLLKEEVDNRLSDICTSSPEKREVREKINSTITRFKKQETVLRDDIEKTADGTDEIDERLHELELQNPQCEQLIQTERLRLELLRAEHKFLLEQRHSELISDEYEEKTELIERMGNALRSCFNLIRGHGYLTPAISKSYKDIVQHLQGRKNIRWCEIPDTESGIAAVTSTNLDDENENQTEGLVLDRTYSAPTSLLELDANKPKVTPHSSSKVSFLTTKFATKSPRPRLKSSRLDRKSPRLNTKSPKPNANSNKLSGKSPRVITNNNENLMRKPFEPTRTVAGNSLRHKNKPVCIISSRPRFKN